MARAATAGELSSFRLDGQYAKLYLGIMQPATVGTAQISSAPSSNDQVVNLSLKSWSWGSGYSTAEKDLLVYIGSAAGGYDKGMIRLRETLTGTPTSMDIGETSEIDFAVDDYVTIVDEFNIHPKHLFIDGSGVVYMDYDISYSDQHADADPTPVLGPLFVPVWLTGATVDVDFDGSGSWVLGDSVDSFSWSAPGASGTSGTATATPTITYNAAGLYRVSCTVTAVNGKTFTGYRYVRVYTAADPPITQFELESLSGSWDTGGWTGRVVLKNDATTTDIRDRALICLFAKDFYGSDGETSIGPIADRETILAIGWVSGESIEWDPEEGTVGFDIQGPQFWLQSMNGYPSGLESVSGTPDAWTEFGTLTPRKGFWHFLHWRTTLTRIIDINLTSDTTEIALFNASPGTLWDQLSSEAFATIFAKPACDRYGRLYVEVEPNIVPTGSRSGWPTVITATTQDLRRPITIERQTVKQCGLVDLSGVFYEVASSTGTPLFSLAPGHIPAWHGASIERYERVALTSQGQANTLAGLILGQRNNKYPNVSLPFACNIRLIDITPHQYVKITISAGDTERGISGTLSMFPKTVSFSYDPNSGILLCDVQAEGETDDTGAPNIDGDVPPDPPEGGNPPLPPPEWDPLPDLNPDWPTTAIAAAFGSTDYSTVGQLYKTTTFTGPGGDDPVWSALSATGLPGTRYIRDMDVDGVDKENDIYVLLSTTGPTTDTDHEIYYSDDGGDSFTKIMDNTTASGAPLANQAGKIFGMAVDPSNAGYMYVTFRSDTNFGGESGLLKTTDYGSSWSYIVVKTGGYNYRCHAVRAVGDDIMVGGAWSAGGGPAFYASDDGASSFGAKTDIGSSDWHPTPHISQASSTFYFNADGSSFGDDLAHNTSLTTYALDRDSDNIPPRGKYLMWKSITDPDMMRVLLVSTGVMYFTDDAWSTMTTGAAMDWTPAGIAWAGDQLTDDDDFDRVILFQGATQGQAGDTLDEEAVFVTDDNGTTQENKSGANYKTAPYTDAIPETAGGICALAVIDRDYYH